MVVPHVSNPEWQAVYDLHLFQIHGMHGPTVYWDDSPTELPDMLSHLDRLNESNAGKYRLIVTLDTGAQYEITRKENA
jgi:hypothetical protein